MTPVKVRSDLTELKIDLPLKLYLSWRYFLYMKFKICISVTIDSNRRPFKLKYYLKFLGTKWLHLAGTYLPTYNAMLN